MSKYLSKDGLSHLVEKIKDLIPDPSQSSPLMDGTSTIGTSNNYARADHVHPSDTSKVSVVEGKGLSTNDLTNALKTNYDDAYSHSTSAHAPSDAEKNVLVGVKVNNVAVAIDAISRTSNITVPTKVSELNNDAGYITIGQVPEGSTASSTVPKVDSGSGSVGTETAFARGDHIHPTDTSRASASDLTTHTGNATVHVTADERTAWNSKVDAVAGKGLSTNDYTTEDKNKLSAFGDASTYALKTDITAMYKYKGSVATVDALPTTGNVTGDVYNVESSGMNYAWDGTKWDSLGEIFTITDITNEEIDEIMEG